jgi:hypothetical protein
VHVNGGGGGAAGALCEVYGAAARACTCALRLKPQAQRPAGTKIS